jgi:hypothetical protein
LEIISCRVRTPGFPALQKLHTKLTDEQPGSVKISVLEVAGSLDEEAPWGTVGSARISTLFVMGTFVASGRSNRGVCPCFGPEED